MNLKIVTFSPKPVVGLSAGLIEVDMDENAEYCFALDRITGKTVMAMIRPPAGIVRFLVPTKYALSPSLIVGIVDTDGSYNVKAVDGIAAQLVDGNTITISQ
ncbi:hypothetical protein L9G74_19125 [Shewanella sp. C32]|uniref:Uncharacterized protein n=1 Tax=Shewanella electrica TaxID=515560 RepID=A0ABT2FQD6_9GAMM|nr:hypothetical protein [Shewanella electrica]MCH1926858.1 hypothetical protein [Shewanella electrica]MCS4558553.1 hypothetical protein [Shewanella electrica]